MNPLIGLGLISGVSSLGSSLFSNFQGQRMSKDMMDYQYKLQQQAIDRQNLYNSPAEQMKRLAAAGLSPNLVYGSGVDGNQSAAANPSMANRKFEMSNPLQDGIQAYQQGRLIDSQLKNQETDRLFTAAKTVGQMLQNTFDDKSMQDRLKTVGQRLTNMITENNLMESNISLNASKANEIQENIKYLEQKTGLTAQQIITERMQPNLIRAKIRQLKSQSGLNDRQRQYYDSLEKLNDQKISTLFAQEAYYLAAGDFKVAQTHWQDAINQLSVGDLTPATAFKMFLQAIGALLK